VLQTDGGRFERVGPAVEYSDADASSVTVQSGVLAYPDPRVTEFRLYVSSTDAQTGYDLHTSWAAVPSSVNNLAYAIQDTALDITTAGEGGAYPGTQVNDDTDRDPNRILVSDTGQPRSFDAARVGKAGSGPDDGIVAFAANTRPVSEGQFGTYPVYALCENSVSAGTLGQGDVAFSSWNIIGEKGCIGRHAVASVDTQVFFASNDGIHALQAQLAGKPVSTPVHNYSAISNLTECLSDDTSLAYYNDDVRGRRELWVSLGQATYALAIDYGRWTILDRARQAYARLGTVLFGAVKEGSGDELPEGALANERGKPGEAVNVYLKTGRLHLGQRGYYRKLRLVWVRQGRPAFALNWRLTEYDPEAGPVEVMAGTMVRGSSDVAFINNGLVREPILDVSGAMFPGETLAGFGAEYELRFTHRPPRLSHPGSGDGSTFQAALTEDPVFNCKDGFTIDLPGVNVPPVWVEKGVVTYGVGADAAPEWVLKEYVNYVP